MFRIMTDIESTAAKRKAYQKAYDAARSEQRKAYYQANKTVYKTRAAAYFQKNKDAYAERRDRWESENAEHARQWYANYYLLNKSVYRERERAAYAKNPEKFKAKHAKRKEAYPERVKAAVNAWRARNPDALAHNNALRRTRKQQATPQWADLDAIKALYREAARLKRETGLEWHVDHEIPLKHPLVCGLHVPANLRVIPRDANQSKGNKFEIS